MRHYRLFQAKVSSKTLVLPRRSGTSTLLFGHGALVDSARIPCRVTMSARFEYCDLSIPAAAGEAQDVPNYKFVAIFHMQDDFIVIIIILTGSTLIMKVSRLTAQMTVV